MNKSARKIAYELINEWEEKSTFPNLALKNTLRAITDQRDRRFITALVYGVVERKITLDHFIEKCTDHKKIESTIRSILRMGIYQMFYMNVPSSAACNTSVDLAKEVGFFRSCGLVNAVLRRCDREREELLLLKKASFSVRYSIAPQLVDLILNQYGKETFIAMMERESGSKNSIHLYHNIKRGSKSDFLKIMQQEGFELEETPSKHLYKVFGNYSPEHSAAFLDGWCHVVGPHSAKAALLLQAGAVGIMDLCAAPGGKTYILASLTDETVEAFDIHPHKIHLLQKEAKRLGHNNIIVTQHDATQLMSEHLNKADFVLCDVPCSGLGMIFKKPDIKYKSYCSSEFTQKQYAILKNGARYLKSGGRLVYSTCTIDRRENEELIELFLEEHPTFSKDGSVLDQGEQLFLPVNGEDGFYIAVLKKD